MDLLFAKKYIGDTLNKSITNTMLANALGMQLSNVSRKIKTKTPLNPTQLDLLEKTFNVKLTDTNKADFDIYPTQLGVIPSELINTLEMKTGIKLSFAQIADIAGVSRQMINKYKDKYLPLDISEKILKYFEKYNLNMDKNLENLNNIIVVVENFVNNDNIPLPAEEKAKMITNLYQNVLDGTLTMDDIYALNLRHLIRNIK